MKAMLNDIVIDPIYEIIGYFIHKYDLNKYNKLLNNDTWNCGKIDECIKPLDIGTEQQWIL